jgi:hypothetical protein
LLAAGLFILILVERGFPGEFGQYKKIIRKSIKKGNALLALLSKPYEHI